MWTYPQLLFLIVRTIVQGSPDLFWRLDVSRTHRRSWHEKWSLSSILRTRETNQSIIGHIYNTENEICISQRQCMVDSRYFRIRLVSPKNLYIQNMGLKAKWQFGTFSHELLYCLVELFIGLCRSSVLP